MDIKEFLTPGNVLTDLAASGKVGLLQGLAQRASDELKLPAELITSALLKREELGSTGTGGGIAIPHARIPGLNKPFGVLVRLKQPINVDAIDEQPVDLMFLLLLPAEPAKEQLNALAHVARILRSAEVRAQASPCPRQRGLFRVMTAP
jgi:PTS system nitrogen regulatory IIA component